jgi:hypothetical protein
MTDSLANLADAGTFILVATGTIFWSFSFGLVKQRSYIKWYGAAILLASAPIACGVGVRAWRGAGQDLCIWEAMAASSQTGSPLCEAAVVPAFIFLTAVSIPAKLVSEELAFRRLLIGCARRTGLVWVLGAAVVAAAWYAVLAAAGIGGVPTIVLGGVGALTAGCVYVLSCSLLVSAVYSGVLAAGYGALELGRSLHISGESELSMPPAIWIPLVFISMVLAVAVMQRHGFVGQSIKVE